MYVKDSAEVKDTLYAALSETLERQKTAYKAPPGTMAYVAMTANDAPLAENMQR